MSPRFGELACSKPSHEHTKIYTTCDQEKKRAWQNPMNQGTWPWTCKSLLVQFRTHKFLWIPSAPASRVDPTQVSKTPELSCVYWQHGDGLACLGCLWNACDGSLSEYWGPLKRQKKKVIQNTHHPHHLVQNYSAHDSRQVFKQIHYTKSYSNTGFAPIYSSCHWSWSLCDALSAWEVDLWYSGYCNSTRSQPSSSPFNNPTPARPNQKSEPGKTKKTN